MQLLVHGASYNHLYWNFPYGNGYYSYVDAATAAGACTTFEHQTASPMAT